MSVGDHGVPRTPVGPQQSVRVDDFVFSPLVTVPAELELSLFGEANNIFA
jgi:hypothetical protein